MQKRSGHLHGVLGSNTTTEGGEDWRGRAGKRAGRGETSEATARVRGTDELRGGAGSTKLRLFAADRRIFVHL